MPHASDGKMLSYIVWVGSAPTPHLQRLMVGPVSLGLKALPRLSVPQDTQGTLGGRAGGGVLPSLRMRKLYLGISLWAIH